MHSTKESDEDSIMNAAKLKSAEQAFLKRYPLGFQDPGLQEIVKKHRGQKMADLAQNAFALERGKRPDSKAVLAAMVKVVSQSSMVSLFEKPKFRDFAATLGKADVDRLAGGLLEFLHGDQEAGFEGQLEVLLKGKLAKWSLITICPAHFNPTVEVFIKPTTAKGAIEHFELKGLVYKPKPSFAFYSGYRRAIVAMKKKVSKKLSPDNSAFGGFLMMSMGQNEV